MTRLTPIAGCTSTFVFAIMLAGCELLQIARVPDRTAIPPTVSVTDAELRRLQDQVLVRVNALRKADGALPLIDDPKMTAVAELYSAELSQRGTIDHTSNTPFRETLSDRLKAGKVSFMAAGENLAKVYGLPTDIPIRSVDLWRSSPGHYRNLIDKRFRRSGMGITRSPTGEWYLVQVFAGP